MGRFLTPCRKCGEPTRNGSFCPTCKVGSDNRPPGRFPSGWGTTSKRIIARDEGICYICGREGADTADHVIPRSRGGPEDDSNYFAAHRSCNSSKGARLL